MANSTQTIPEILDDLKAGDLEEAITEQRGSVDQLHAAWKTKDGPAAIIALDRFMLGQAMWIANNLNDSAESGDQ